MLHNSQRDIVLKAPEKNAADDTFVTQTYECIGMLHNSQRDVVLKGPEKNAADDTVFFLLLSF